MQCPVNVYYNGELKVTKTIPISTIDSLYDGIRETIAYSMTQSIPKNAKYDKVMITKKGMLFGNSEVNIVEFTEVDLKNIDKIDIYLKEPQAGGRKKRKSRKTRKNKRV
jgi:hypothetical protein